MAHASFDTSATLRQQWSNPKDIFTILLIVGGDVVQKAIAQVCTGPIPRFTPVTFSFGWVSYAVSAMLSAFGENRLMPLPEVDCLVVNVRSGYARSNRSWLLSRLLRDIDSWLPSHLHNSRDTNGSRPQVSSEAQIKGRPALRITVFSCDDVDGRGTWDWVYSSGILVTIVQIIGLGLPPLLLYGEYFTILVASCGTMLAWANGAIYQWTEEKIGVRFLKDNQSKDIILTQGQGSYDVILLRASGQRNLDLEALAGGQRKSNGPQATRMASATLAALWIILLTSVAGWEQHTWYILGVGMIGMVHNIFVAGKARSPKALGIPVVFQNMYIDNKVMKVLWKLESDFPGAGACLLNVFFPGDGVRPSEQQPWADTRTRYDKWKALGCPPIRQGTPGVPELCDAAWVEDPTLYTSWI